MHMRTGKLLIAGLVAIAVPALASAQTGGTMPAGHDPSKMHAGAAGGHDAIPHQEDSAIGGLRRAIPFEVGQRNVKAILIDGRDVWIGSSGGVIRYDTHRGSYLTYDNKSGLLSNGVFSLSKSGDEVWVGTYGGGLSVLDPAAGSWRNYNIPDGMGDAFVYGTLAMPNGDIWIATWSGANRVRGGRMDDIASWDLYTVENTGGGLPNDWVYGLAAGKDGEVWLATEGGLARFRDEGWTHWTHADGLGAPLEQVEGNIGFSNDPGQYSSHHARQKQEQGLGEVKVAYNPNYIVALAVTRDGAVWAGTWGAGLSRFDGSTWQTFTTADGLPSNHIFSLHTDAAGRLWIGTSQGLALREGEGFAAYGAESGLNVQSIFAIATSGDTAWVGGYGGVTWFPYGLGAPGKLKAGGN